MNFRRSDLYILMGAVLFGIILSYAIYLLLIFVALFSLFSIALIILLITDWKSNIRMVVLTFSFCLLAFFTAYAASTFSESNIKRKADKVVEKIYVYKSIHKQFPQNLSQIGNIPEKYSYTVDSNFTAFQLYYRGMYGFPCAFNSRDSTWSLP